MNNSNNSDQNKDESSIKTEIQNILMERVARYRNSYLAPQIQKALPDFLNLEKRDSLHEALQQMSEESLLQHSHAKKKVVFELPRKSLITPEITMEEYVIPGTEEQLLTDSFVRKLPVPITDKRHYRKSILVSLKRKPWYSKLCDCLEKKWENFLSLFDLWNNTLNIIEGQHGAAVVSYFVFLRWLLYMNIFICLLNFLFLVVPQIIIPHPKTIPLNHTVLYFPKTASSSAHEFLKGYLSTMTWGEFNLIDFIRDGAESLDKNITNSSSVETIVEYCLALYAKKIANDTQDGISTAIQSFLQGTGPLEPTHLFMGFYPPYNVEADGYVYYMSTAFLCILLASFIVSLYMMIQYSSVGTQEAFMLQTRHPATFSNHIFSSWEFCITRLQGAERHHYRIVLDMKASLYEDRFAKLISERTTRTWAKLYALRFLINITTLTWLLSCCYLIYSVTVYQMKEKQIHALSKPGLKTLLLQFLPSITVIFLNSISPPIFDILVIFEEYSVQTKLNISLFRNVVLHLSSIIILLNTFYNQVVCKAKDICRAGVDETCHSPRCWETYIGQQLYRLTITDLFVYIGVFLYDVLHYYITQKCDNKCTRLLGLPRFFLPTEVLPVIISQTVLWLGVFYSPLLPAVVILKLIIIFYIKKTKVLKFCEPSDSPFRASRVNSVFIFVMLISFFVVLIVQSFAVENISPSRGCGPFRYFDVMTEAIPPRIRSWLSILMSYWALAFLVFILCSAIHYYCQILASQKELIKRLKTLLVLESYDKQFLLKSIADLTEGKTPKQRKTI